MGTQSIQHVSFVLLAEFHVNEGSILPYQYPFPTGTDDQLLAELMIPDGAHANEEDWTFFFLNQSPANTIAPVFSDAQSIDGNPNEPGEQTLLYVLNLVRTKKDAAAPRGGWVKALAICTRHPFINVFRHALMKTLDEFYASPSVDVLAGLYDAINAMDLSHMPMLSRAEKLILRSTDRKDLFSERFVHSLPSRGAHDAEQNASVVRTDQDETITLQRSKFELVERANSPFARTQSPSCSDRSGSVSSGHSSHIDGEWKDYEDDDDTAGAASRSPQEVDAEDGFTLLNTSDSTPRPPSRTAGGSSKTAVDQRSMSSKVTMHQRHGSNTSTARASISDCDMHSHPRWESDTHSYPSSIVWRKMVDDASAETVIAKIDVSIPTCSFSGEVGDYSLTRLVDLFCKPTAAVSGPLHPHLHTNGALTHPLIVLFNALVTQKRIIFLGHGRPANQVARYVLAACAFGSGCGVVLRGFTHRAFPYTNLTNHSVMTSVPGFIAGVTNPIYEATPGWDILCNIESGRITVNKDIQSPAANASLFPQPPSTLPRQGSNGAVGSDEDLKPSVPNGVPVGKPGENYDSMFIDELQGLNEMQLRARVTEFVLRFVQLAARHEEDTFGSTAICFPSLSFSDGQLGSGTIPEDPKEMAMNIGRIEGWRRSVSYELFKADSLAQMEGSTIHGIDVCHQIARLRMGRSLPDAEVHMIMQLLSQSVRSYEQVVELLSHLPLYNGGLMPLAFALFHPLAVVRDCTVDLLSNIRSYKIGVQYLRCLNHFHRMAYVRLAFARESAVGQSPITNNGRLGPPQSSITRTSSNLSSASVGAG